jgi:hypothetical protein
VRKKVKPFLTLSERAPGMQQETKKRNKIKQRANKNKEKEQIK